MSTLVFKGTERFAIQRRLGAGSFGVVYQAFDRERNTKVALKALRLDDANALYRFKKEFRALADVTHPNLITLYELICAGEQWFFTMELINGVNFLTYTSGLVVAEISPSMAEASTFGTLALDSSGEDYADESNRTLPIAEELADRPTVLSPHEFNGVDIERLRASLWQLAQGLNAIHAAGKLHRDLKPSNVLVTNEGRVVILDFGLITELTAEEANASEDLIGTPNYMAPELAVGGNVTTAADWYSVGVMLFQALTGQLPFTGKTFQVLANKQKFDGAPPNTIVPDIPPDLNQLCADLLRRAPDERPTGEEVVKRLEEARRHLSSARQSVAVEIAPTALIGRERHFAQLNEAYDQLKHGRAVTVRVHGQSGMGKSALVKYFCDERQRRDRDLVLLTGRCYANEAVPYKALDSVVDALSQYLKRLPEGEASWLMPRDVLALARLFPVLKQVNAVAGAQRRVLEIQDSLELRRRAFTALRELLARLGAKHKLVIFIDDLQWGDIDSGPLLRELLRPPDPPLMMLIITYRTGEEATSPLLRAFIASLPQMASQVREIAVGELDRAESLALAAALAESEQHEERIRFIAQESAGSPFFISELARFAREAAEQQSESGGLPRLDTVIQKRVAMLPGEARRLLETVAIAGQPLELSVASRAAGLDKETPGALSTLRAYHLIRTRGSRDHDEIEIYHDRIREAITAGLEPSSLRSHHLQLALALERSGEADAEMLVTHFHAAGESARAAAYAVTAAEQTAEALAFDRAARLYRLALELQNSSAEIPHSAYKLRVKLADALANAGRGAEAASEYLIAVETAGVSRSERLELQRRASEQLLLSGHIDEGMKAIRSVLATIGMRPATSKLSMLASLFARRAWLSLRGLNFTVRDESEIAPEELIRIDTCYSLTVGLAMVNLLRSLDFQTRNLLLALKAGEPFRVVRALTNEVSFTSLAGSRAHKKTAKLLRHLTAAAAQTTNPIAAAFVPFTGGIVAFNQYRWREAVELGDRAEKLFRERCAGVASDIDLVQIFLLRAFYYLGELSEMSHRLRAWLESAEERGDLYAATNFRTRISYLTCLMEDRPEQALREARDGINRWPKKGFHAQHLFAFFAEVEIALYEGNGKEAWRLLNERWARLIRSPFLRSQFLFIELYHLHARCALAGATTSERAAMIKAAAQDARRLEREKVVWASALAQLVRAAIAARTDEARARELLAGAEKAFTSVDMGLFAAAARRQRGHLIGGAQGADLIADADAWMARQGILAPARFTAMLAPF